MFEGDITGASPKNPIARNGSSMLIIVTYKDRETRDKVLKAAKKMGLLGHPKTLGGMAPFFTEVTSPRLKTLEAKDNAENLKVKNLSKHEMNEDQLADAREKLIRSMKSREENVRRSQGQGTALDGNGMESYWNKMSQEAHEAKEPGEHTVEPLHIREAQYEAEMESKEQGQDNAEDACPNSSNSQVNGSIPKSPEAKNDARNILNEIREQEIEVTEENVDSIAQTIDEETEINQTLH